MLPGLFALQVRAIAEAACFRERMGGDPRAEIMVPLVGSIQELELVIDEAAGVLESVAEAHGCSLQFPIGTMIELPRAALTAGQIAEAAEFFSFGTNDLTQTRGASAATMSRLPSSRRIWRRVSSAFHRSSRLTAGRR